MRVSPIGYAFDSIDKVLKEAKKSAEVTHNHPSGIKGAQATAACVFLARKGRTREEIREYAREQFDYKLTATVEKIRKVYSFDISCDGTVPEAIISFLESEDIESAIRNAISLGGDADTLACITGGIAEAFYKQVPAHIEKKVREILPDEMLDIMDRFYEKYIT